MRTKAIFGLVLSLVLLAAAPQQTVGPEALLGLGIHQEEAQGDLEAAIATYTNFLKQYSGNRALAAEAQFRLGQAYEKLGRAEASKAYERVLSNFADQAEYVALARTRLAALRIASEETAPKAKFQKVKMPTRLYSSQGALSPDGKRLAFIAEDSVWVVPVQGKAEPGVTGIPVRLTEPMGAYAANWSGDGNWIVINAREGVYVIPSDGGAARKVLDPQYGTFFFESRLSLSPDGSNLAYSSGSLEDKAVHVVATGNGDTHKISSEGGAVMPAFSPNGKRIAYVTLHIDHQERRRQGKLWVASIEGGESALVSSLPGSPSGPVWSPDGTMIAFPQTQERWQEGKPDLRIVHVSSEGKPVGEPVRFELPFRWEPETAGWTSDNKIGLFAWNEEQQAIYTVPATGGRATRVTPKSWAAHPRWSPDGKRIFLRWADDNGPRIAFVPADGGPLTEVPVASSVVRYEAAPGGGNAISPDGKMIVFTGASLRNQEWVTNIWTLPVQGGQPTRITNNAGPDTRFPCWSPDGKSIAFVARDDPMKNQRGEGPFSFQIYAVPAQGGEARKLTSVEHKVAWAPVAWSQDGRQIAYFSVDRELNVIPAGGGRPRIVVSLSKNRSGSFAAAGALAHFEMSWSPDGKRLAYAFGGRLWTVPLAGGEPEEVRTGLSDVAPTNLDWSPDGKTIAFTGAEGGDYELWLMEDFIDLVKTGR